MEDVNTRQRFFFPFVNFGTLYRNSTPKKIANTHEKFDKLKESE